MLHFDSSHSIVARVLIDPNGSSLVTSLLTSDG